MSWENYDDVVGQMRAHDLAVDTLEVDTPRPVRCYLDSRRDREKRGWYWLTTAQLPMADGSGQGAFIVGSFGIWEGTENNKVKVALTKRQAVLSAEQRKAIAARHRENARRAEALRKAEQQRAAAKARKVWSRYLPTGHSPYLERKGVQAHGVRFAPNGAGTIAIPMQDTAGQTHGLQIIRGPQRGRKLEKEYWPRGHAKRGHFYLIGIPGPVLPLAEGFSTGATLHEATGFGTVVAFDANNLLPVAQALAKAYPRSRILVCADDDYLQRCKACGERTEVAEPKCSHCGEPHRAQNPGQEAARSAALAVSGAWVAPQFPGNRDGAKLTDFNDLHHFPGGGQAVVRDQVLAAIEAAGWKLQGGATPVARESSQGERGVGWRPESTSVMDVDELVERFTFVDEGTGKHVWDEWTRQLVSKEKMVALLPPKVRMDEVKSHVVWRSKSYYVDEIGFDPSEQDPSVKCNTWRGWPLKPKPGKCELWLELLEYLCGGRNGEEMAQWLLRWLAYPLQHPGAKLKTTVIVHGPQGSGKNTLFEAIAKIYVEYSAVLDQRGLEDRFNLDWADSKLFIVADEVVTRAEMYSIKNELKALITGEWIRVNPKGLAAYRQRNQINIVFLSNEHQPFPIDPDDRRHAVIWTPPPLGQDFYDELYAEMEDGGIEALYHHLLNVDLGDFHPAKRPPETEAKANLIAFSKPSEDRFIDDWRGGDTRWPFGPVLSMDLYGAYVAWCKQHGVRYPRESNQFLGKIRKYPGWACGPYNVHDTTHCDGPAKRRRMVIPAPDELERAGVGSQPPDRTKTQWLTERYLAFRIADEGY